MPSVMAPEMPYANGKSAKLTNGHTVIPPKSPTDSLSDELDSTTLQPILRRPSSKRKLSSPLMPAFMVSAPGKVIVYGEHAVVHGKVRKYNRNSLLFHGTDIMIPGCYRCCDIPSILPPSHISVKIETNRYAQISRYCAGSHVEHRRFAMVNLREARQEEELL